MDHWIRGGGGVVNTRLYLLCTGFVGLFDSWCPTISHWNLAWNLSLVYVTMVAVIALILGWVYGGDVEDADVTLSGTDYRTINHRPFLKFTCS